MRFSIQFLLFVLVILVWSTSGQASLCLQDSDRKNEPTSLQNQDSTQDDPVTSDGDQDPPPRLSDMELIERVEVLQRQLESAEIPRRDAAEQELVQLGIRVLDYLEPPTEQTPTDAIRRTNAVRGTLEKIVVASATKASRVTLSGKMTVAAALDRIGKQTRNDVALHEGTPDVFLDREVELNLADVSFWEALGKITELGDLQIDTYGGSRGKLRLTPTQDARIRAANPGMAVGNADTAQPQVPRCVSGIFNLAVTQINASRHLANPALDYCNIHMSIRWEPRVTPISIDLPTNSIKVIDEFDNPIKITNQDAVISGIVQPDISELEFSVPIALVDRQIEVIKSFTATIDAVVTGRTETFKFRKLGRLDPGTEQTKAGATVTFDGIRKNEDLFGITVRLSFDEEHNALESHQNWVYNNQIYLENEAGESFESLAYEAVTQTNNEVAIRYYFEQDPKDMTLFYKTPAAIVAIPVKVSLSKIPLP